MILYIANSKNVSYEVVNKLERRIKSEAVDCFGAGTACFDTYTIYVNGNAVFYMSQSTYPTVEKNGADYITNTIVELLVDKMATNGVVDLKDVVNRAKAEYKIKFPKGGR